MDTMVGGQLAGTDFFNTGAWCDVQTSFGFRREPIWVDLASLKMEKIFFEIMDQAGVFPATYPISAKMAGALQCVSGIANMEELFCH